MTADHRREADVLPLPQLIRARAEDPVFADRVYLDDLDGRTFTYSEIHEEVRAWVAAFQRAGVEPGDRVSIMMGNSPTAAAVWLALGWVGAVEAPLNTAYQGRMLVDLINSSESTLMVLEERYVERVERESAGLTSLQQLVVVGDVPADPGLSATTADEFLDGAAEAKLGEGPRPHDIATIIFTSGTTGPSKGVLVPWALLRATALGGWPTWDLREDDAFYSPLPQYHSSGKNPLYMMAITGGRVVLRRRFKTDRFIEDVNRSGSTTTLLLGAMVTFLDQLPPSPDDADIALRNVLMAPLPPDLERFTRRFGVRACTGYSMTEISSPLASMGWDPANTASCGVVRPGYDVRVVDDEDRPVPAGVPGELVVRSEDPWVLMAGYWNRPEATVEAWRNLWFHTGDLFTYDEDGHYYFVDRKKDAIRRRGENISSYEIEREIHEHPAVAECSAVAVPSELSEDEVCVFVVLREGATLTGPELLDFLVPRLPHFMVPRYVRVLDRLPKTPTQKIQKAELRGRGVDHQTWDRVTAGYQVARSH